MKLQIIYTNKTCQPARLTNGFTIIEMLIVVSIIVTVGGIGLFFGFDSLRGYSFRSDRDVLVSALQHARAEAMANICRGTCTDGKPHGVYVDAVNHKFIIFQTENSNNPKYIDQTIEDKSYNAEIDGSSLVTHNNGVDTEVVFKQLSGETSCSVSCDITLKDNTGRIDILHINSEGQIIWDH